MVPVVPISFYLNVIIMLFHLEMQPVWFGSHDLGLCSQGFMLSEGRARFRQVSLTESHRTWGWFLSSCFLLKVHRFITCHNHELRYPPFSDPTTILSWWYIYIYPHEYIPKLRKYQSHSLEESIGFQHWICHQFLVVSSNSSFNMFPKNVMVDLHFPIDLRSL